MNILSIQSHVAYGHVGNASAVFPMQRLGVEVWPIHTVQFSNHTGYGAWRGRVFDGPAIEDWCAGIARARRARRPATAVLSGYMGSADIGTAILRAVAAVRAANPQALYCCDPVIGDIGRGVYVRPGIAEFMREHAVPAADILTPNQFELDLLTGLPSRHPRRGQARASPRCRRCGPRVVLVTSLAHRRDAGRRHRPAGRARAARSGACARPRLDLAVNGAGDGIAALFLVHYARTRLGRRWPSGMAAASVYGLLRRTAEAGSREILTVAAQDEFVDAERDVSGRGGLRSTATCTPSRAGSPTDATPLRHPRRVHRRAARRQPARRGARRRGPRHGRDAGRSRASSTCPRRCSCCRPRTARHRARLRIFTPAPRAAVRRPSRRSAPPCCWPCARSRPGRRRPRLRPGGGGRDRALRGRDLGRRDAAAGPGSGCRSCRSISALGPSPRCWRRCLGLEPGEIGFGRHRPSRHGVGPSFTFVPVASRGGPRRRPRPAHGAGFAGRRSTSTLRTRGVGPALAGADVRAPSRRARGPGHRLGGRGLRGGADAVRAARRRHPRRRDPPGRRHGPAERDRASAHVESGGLRRVEIGGAAVIVSDGVLHV